MDPFVRVYVDSNIFIYLFEGNDERAKDLRSTFLAYRKSERRFFATSELTLAETLVGAYRKKDEDLVNPYDSWTISNREIEVGPVDRTILWRSAILRERYQPLKLPDAIHLATASAFGCSHFLSGDRRLGTRKDFVDPRSWLGNGAASIQIIEPERSVLELIRASI